MKRILLSIIILSLALCVCACKRSPSDTQWWEDTGTQSTDTEGSAQPSPIEHLYGEWENEQGEREIIDADTIGGSGYSVDSVTVNEYGDVTAKVSVSGSHVIYTVYRYKVGYAEYSYMQAHIEAKNVTINYTK